MRDPRDLQVRVHRRGEEPPDDVCSYTTAAERLEAVNILSHRGWELVRAGVAAGVNGRAATAIREGGWSADWTALLETLSRHGVRYLLVGAHALGVHAEPRATKDLDIWVEPTIENATKVWEALRAFGAPLADQQVSVDDFAKSGTNIQLGAWLGRVDVFTEIVGVPDFVVAWDARLVVALHGVDTPIIGRDHFVAAKRASGRLQDLADLERMGEEV